jgi:hypothetical protein
MRCPRSALVLSFALVLSLSTASIAHAGNPVQGRWTAQLPGGSLSYYHFKAGVVESDGTTQGRFVHMYLDERSGERLVHGTYVLAPYGPWGNWGKLTLLFDDGRQIKDIEHREPGVLKLYHVALGRAVIYHRQ